jgi:hypothetical protein
MSTWHTERGVFVYRPRLGPGLSPLPVEEPEFPWIAVPILSLGFVLFFAGLALIGVEWRLWEGALAGVGVGLIVTGFATLARRFL